MAKDKTKIIESDEDILYQCLDKVPPAQLVVVRKKGSELRGEEPIDRVLEKNPADQYVIEGYEEPEVKELMVQGMERAIKKKGYAIVCLNELSDGDTKKVMAGLAEEPSPAEKLQAKTLELAEASESLEEAKERIAELEAAAVARSDA